MKVLLTRPDSPMNVCPVPLGLGALSHALKTRRGDVTRILDGRLFRLDPQSMLAEIARFGPDLVGVTAMTYEAPETLDLISRIKERWPKVTVIMGGPHATGYGPALLEKCRADFLVLGEGEETLVELISAVESGKDPGAVPGIAFRQGEDLVVTDERGPITDTASLGTDWEGIGPERYFSSWRRNALNTIALSKRRLPVFFSRGCPFGCAYCHHIFGRRHRAFPPERVVGEMIELRDRYRLGEFEIIDDNFNLDPEYAKRAMQEVIDKNLGVKLAFSSGLRADRMDEELLDLMIRAGTYRIDYAVESASPRIQKLCKKNLDLGRAREVINMTARRGVVTGAYYMLGFPTETAEEMQATLEYALSLENHIASFFYLLPFPGTEFAESDPEVRRLVRSREIRDASELVVNLSAATDEQLQRARKSGYGRFYFSPRRMMKIARDVPKSPRLAAAALAAARLSFQEGVNY